MPQYLREVPSASINKNTWNIPVHYNSTSIRLKYHSSPPQSIFKWWYFPCGGVRVKRSSRINDDRRCQHAQLAAAASPGVTFDFPPADCFEFFFFLWWVLNVHSPSPVTCQDVHWCRVPGQLHRCTCTSWYSLFIFRETHFLRNTSKLLIFEMFSLRQRISAMILSFSCHTNLGQRN